MDLNISNNSCHYSEPYPPIQAALRVFGNLPIILIGLTTNILNIIIFRHSRMRSSLVNWCLLALAVSDQVVLVSTFFMLSFPVMAEMFSSLTLIELSNYMTRWFYPFGQISQTSGVCLTVFVSIYRYMGVCHPFMTQRLITPNLIKIGIATAFSTAFLFNITRWWEITMKPCFSYIYNSSSMIVKPAAMGNNANYFLYYRVYAYTGIMFAIPFCILITVNSFIIATLHKSRKLRRQMTMTRKRASPRKATLNITNRAKSTPNGEVISNTTMNTTKVKVSTSNATLAPPNTSMGQSRSKAKDDHESKEHSTTLMLLAVVCLFLICNSLAFINNILEISRLSQTIDHIVYTVLIEIGNLLVTLNSSVTFFIYTTFSTKFRQLLKLFIMRAIRRNSVDNSHDYMPLSTMQATSTCAYSTNFTKKSPLLIRPNPAKEKLARHSLTTSKDLAKDVVIVANRNKSSMVNMLSTRNNQNSPV